MATPNTAANIMVVSRTIIAVFASRLCCHAGEFGNNIFPTSLLSITLRLGFLENRNAAHQNTKLELVNASINFCRVVIPNKTRMVS